MKKRVTRKDTAHSKSRQGSTPLHVQVAKLCGWTHITDFSGRGYYYGTMPNSTDRTSLPLFDTDLNAMQSAEQFIFGIEDEHGGLADIYDRNLHQIAIEQDCVFVWHMNARQKAEAFVKTFEFPRIHNRTPSVP